MNTTLQPRRLRSPRERVGSVAKAALPPPTLGENALLAALRRRDEAAFEALLDRFHSPMLDLARGYVRSRAEAEDVVQEAWVGVLRGIDRFQGRSTLKTWIFRILINRARSRTRREARSSPFSELALSGLTNGSGGASDAAEIDFLLQGEGGRAYVSDASVPADPEAQVLAGEMSALIRAQIDQLPRRQQQVITLRDIDGWSAAEVCGLLQISEANQRVLLHRARVKVRDALHPYLAAGDHDYRVN